jgi:hypothetical protein
MTARSAPEGGEGSGMVPKVRKCQSLRLWYHAAAFATVRSQTCHHGPRVPHGRGNAGEAHMLHVGFPTMWAALPACDMQVGQLVN